MCDFWGDNMKKINKFSNSVKLAKLKIAIRSKELLIGEAQNEY